MSTEQQAQALADWLEAVGTAPPDALDPDVVEAVVSLRPEHAPAPRVSVDDILAGVRAGPFASPEAGPPPVDAGEPELAPVIPLWRRPVVLVGGGVAGLGALAVAALAALVWLPLTQGSLNEAPVYSAESTRVASSGPLADDDAAAVLDADTGHMAREVAANVDAPPPGSAAPPGSARDASAPAPVASARPVAQREGYAIPAPEPAPEPAPVTSTIPEVVAAAATPDVPVLAAPSPAVAGGYRDDAVADAEPEEDAESWEEETRYDLDRSAAATGVSAVDAGSLHAAEDRFDELSEGGDDADLDEDLGMTFASDEADVPETVAVESRPPRLRFPTRNRPRRGPSAPRAEERADDLAAPAAAPAQAKATTDSTTVSGPGLAGLDPAEQARAQVVQQRSLALAAEGRLVEAAQTRMANVRPPASFGQAEAVVATAWLLQAGLPWEAAAAAQQGLALGDSASRARLQALYDQAQAQQLQAEPDPAMDAIMEDSSAH